jgi:hypothetical protein
MDGMTHRKMRATLALGAAAAVTLFAVPAGFAHPTNTSGLVATTLGSQDPRDTAQSENTAGLVPRRLGSPDPRDTVRKSQKSNYASGTVAARLGSPDPRDTARSSESQSGLVPSTLGSSDPRDTARPDGPTLRAYFDVLAAQAADTRAVPTQPESAFSWHDAGIGAGAALLCVAGLGLAAVAIRHNRRHVASPA